MLAISERASAEEDAVDRLVLPFELRRKSRLRVRLESGEEAAVFLERGSILRDGDKLKAEDGRIIEVLAADEAIARVTAVHASDLLRAAYHLGNRHIPLQVTAGAVILEQDHVLEHMLLGLGVTIQHEQAPFEPESGAYGGGHHHHHDDDEHEHDHSHGHHHHHDHHG